MNAFQFGALLREKLAAGPATAEKPILTPTDYLYSKVVPYPSGAGGVGDAIIQDHPLHDMTGNKLPADVVARNFKAQRRAFDALSRPYKDPIRRDMNADFSVRGSGVLSGNRQYGTGVYNSGTHGGAQVYHPQTGLTAQDRADLASLPKLPQAAPGKPAAPRPSRGTGMSALKR